MQIRTYKSYVFVLKYIQKRRIIIVGLVLYLLYRFKLMSFMLTEYRAFWTNFYTFIYAYYL